MSVYPADNVPELLCERCFQPADVAWCDVTSFDELQASVVAGRMTCRTEGCVDHRGSRQTRTPPTPDELAARGIRSMEELLRIAAE